ncbi:MAG: cyclomaltodextrinase N-terminal domain-containing protein, partial [Bacteroidales bacterium]|nr:cyclomaltodextrinase N-terminal domain-containing protein [Bacteroidales bacterium]
MKRIVLSGLIIFLLLGSVLGQNSIDRIEPPFWWVGMNNPELQVMLYGQDIGELRPAVNNEAVTLKRFEKVESNNYIFLYFRVNRQAEPGSFTVHLKNGDETVNSFDYRLKAREKNSAGREGFNNSDVMYLITPDRFANGNPGNDAVEGYRDKPDRSDDYGRHGGDIQGIINRLDYIDEMGFTAIWLNPVLENAMAEASYHGYATTDYYKVDPRFGSNKLYKKLSEEAQKRGIKL